MSCSVRVQRICEIISPNSSKITILKNLDPRKFSAIMVLWFLRLDWQLSSRGLAGLEVGKAVVERPLRGVA